ncbi:MAG TPA: hypothetical protein VMS17_30175 [Gemmataceae bacterium]|nr:hypothetical protein [Gemmataceae bacterium]
MTDGPQPLQTVPRSSRLFDAAWFLFWAVLSSVWCVTAASQLSATFDEPLHLERGLERWRTGSTAGLMSLGAMPLPMDVETLPLYLWERCHGIRLDPVGNLDHLLPWARASALLFWWVLLFYAWRLARSFGGPWAARLAVAYLACEPNFLAHASLALTDTAVTACLLVLVYHFRAGRDGGWLRRVGVPAVCFAAAVLAKASGLAYAGLCMIVIEAERRLAPVWDGDAKVTAKALWTALWRRPARGTFRGDLVQIVLLGLGLVFVYCGSDWQPQTSGLAWARSLPPGPFGICMVWFFEHARVFSNAGEGIVRQVRHNMLGHGVYVLGQVYPRYVWYYYPLVLTIKLCEPLLFAPVVLLIVRPRSLRNAAALSALVLLLFSLNAHVQIGVRLMLPLVALAVVGVSAAAVNAVRSFRPGTSARIAVGFCVASVLWCGVASWAVWPSGLTYVNRMWGDPTDGYRLVSDSNWDWGQGVKELARWQRRRGDGSLDVWYFGSDPRIDRAPLRALALHGLSFDKPEEVGQYLRGRRLAVSTTLAYGCLYGLAPSARVAQHFLATQKPVGRTSTFLIYDFTADGAAGNAASSP